MMSNEILERLKKRLLDLDMEGTIADVKSIINSQEKTRAKDAVDVISDALGVVGKRFQGGEWFLTDLVYAGEIAREAMNLLSPLMVTESSESRGTIVVGTVAGDLHDLGKNIFISFAKSAGFQVIDLGVDISVQKFITAVKEYKPFALGISCLLTSTDKEIQKVIQELNKQNIRDRVKVIIGGAALTEEFSRSVGADAFAPDAVTGTDIVKKWSAA